MIYIYLEQTKKLDGDAEKYIWSPHGQSTVHLARCQKHKQAIISERIGHESNVKCLFAFFKWVSFNSLK